MVLYIMDYSIQTKLEFLLKKLPVSISGSPSLCSASAKTKTKIVDLLSNNALFIPLLKY
jgi:hypothetical protein